MSEPYERPLPVAALLLALGVSFGAPILVASTGRPRPPAVRPEAPATQAQNAPAEVRAPAPAPIPDGPVGAAIRRGQEIVTRTAETLPDHVGNGLHCTSCHLEGGTKPGAAPWVGLPGVFPEYRARSGRVDLLERRINDCFERSMNGTALDPNSDDMTAIVAYMTWISRDVPSGRTPPGRGFRRIDPPRTPNRENGQAVYAQRCASCHGADGAGQSPGGQYGFPALWGDRSYNIAAGMARLDTAAAFVRTNMPLGQGNTLSEQEAYDVADYFIHQPRPDFARKNLDWPRGGRPRDARY